MKGMWFVIHNRVCGETLIQVCRVKNLNEVMHAGNLDFYGTFETDKEAQACADRLNKEEGGG